MPAHRVNTRFGPFTVVDTITQPQLFEITLDGAMAIIMSHLPRLAGAEGIDAVMSQLFAFTESVTARAYDILLTPDTATPAPACAAGCDHCCNLQVTATPFELIAIHRYLQGEAPWPRETLRARLRDYLAVRLSVGAPFCCNIHRDTRDALYCPFLVDGRCAIYPVRPVVCRGYNSCNRALCRLRAAQPEVDIPISREEAATASFRPQYEMARAVTHALIFTLSGTALPGAGAVYDLTAGLQRLTDTPNAVHRWLNGGAVFPPPA
jgi:Fe-S-cluster containining protein